MNPQIKGIKVAIGAWKFYMHIHTQMLTNRTDKSVILVTIHEYSTWKLNILNTLIPIHYLLFKRQRNRYQFWPVVAVTASTASTAATSRILAIVERTQEWNAESEGPCYKRPSHARPRFTRVRSHAIRHYGRFDIPPLIKLSGESIVTSFKKYVRLGLGVYSLRQQTLIDVFWAECVIHFTKKKINQHRFELMFLRGFVLA